jgi:hypothetical protein
VLTRNVKAHALALSRVTVKGCQGGVHPRLVLKNTNRLGSTLVATITRQAALRNSSRSVANRPPFLRVEPILAMARHMVERLTETPLTASTYSQSAP